MRLKNKPWSKDLIHAHPEYIQTFPDIDMNHWNQRFQQTQPIEIEVGSGKGKFITEMAQAFPQINFIAVEVQEAAIAMILKKQVTLNLPNLQLLLANGANLNDLFPANFAEKIYLNFSDPWPKKRHVKRRLTYQSFLKQYQKILLPHAQVELKTDNRGFFEYSLVSMSQFPMYLDFVSLDLHHDDRVTFNVETEYEHKFTIKGQPIYQAIAHF